MRISGAQEPPTETPPPPRLLCQLVEYPTHLVLLMAYWPIYRDDSWPGCSLIEVSIHILHHKWTIQSQALIALPQMCKTTGSFFCTLSVAYDNVTSRGDCHPKASSLSFF